MSKSTKIQIDLERPIAFHPQLARIFGSIESVDNKVGNCNKMGYNVFMSRLERKIIYTYNLPMISSAQCCREICVFGGKN